MLITIYNIYVDSLIFIWRNVFVILPYAFYYILELLLHTWFPDSFLLEYIIPITILCFVEMCIVIVVYKKEEIIVTKEPIFNTFNRNSGNLLLLTAFFSVIIIGLALIFAIWSIFFDETSRLIDLIYVSIALILFAIYPLSLRHMIFYSVNIVGDSIKAGFKELYKNFFFYLFVTLIGILLSIFPSLFLPSSWLMFPLLPVVERSGLGLGNEINFVGLFLNIVLSTLTSIALTYAFILKNKKFKHDS